VSRAHDVVHDFYLNIECDRCVHDSAVLMFSRAYAATCADVDESQAYGTHATFDDAHGAVIARAHERCVVRANVPVAMFLQRYAQEVHEKAPESGFHVVLGRASANVVMHGREVYDEASAREVRGVGARVVEVLTRFWEAERSARASEYGETLKARNPNAGLRPVSGDVECGGAAASTSMSASLTKKRGVAGATAAAQTQTRTRNKKPREPWEPQYKTAAFALLVTLHKLALEGKDVVSKRELELAAEDSGLSANGILPRAQVVTSGRGRGRGRGAAGAAQYQYCGWSAFNSHLKNTPRGHDAPMVHTWGNPMSIRLTPEGEALGRKLHAFAEIRGDCRCGRMTAKDIEMVIPSEKNGSDAMVNGDGNGNGNDDDDDDDELVIIEDEVEDAVTTTNVASTSQKSTQESVPSTSTVRKQQRSAAGSFRNVISGAYCPPRETTYVPQCSLRDTPKVTSIVDAETHDWRLPPLDPGQTYGEVYETVFVLDSCEQATKNGVRKLEQMGLPCLIHKLPYGDAAWMARRRGASLAECYMLDFIIERKRLDDLLASIIGNRYDAQKFHLHRCGIKNLMYLLEGNVEAIPDDVSRRRVRTARVQTEIFDEFRVVNTEGTNDTIDFFGNFTRALDATYAPLKRNEKTQTLPSYPEFIKTCSELADSEKTLRTIWASMIAQVPGIGPGGAEAIAARYPTPSHLKRAIDADRASAQFDLAEAVVNARKLGPAAAKRVFDAFFPSH